MPSHGITGMLTLEEFETQVAACEIDTVLAVFADLYGRLLGKRIAADFFLEKTVAHGMQVCDYLLTVDMEMEVVEGYRFASWDQGYGDLHCVPDLATLRRISWLDRSALVFCDLERDRVPAAVSPRAVLRAQIDRLAAAGYAARCGSELEYYIFAETYGSARQKGFEGLETFGWYIEDYHMLQGTKAEALNGAVRRHMAASGIPVETSKGEWGPGQHELNLRYADPLEMADRHALYKQGFKEIACQQDLAVTFMAKWRTDLAGSSMHLHLSLWDRDEETNVFPGTRPSGPVGVSPEFLHFLGGWMTHARAIAPFYAPYPNSYKRYVSQSWAPTALGWGHDNRTAGFRVVGTGDSLRIECRIPGADANPYLAIAATLAAGLDGLQGKTAPPPLSEGDTYESQDLQRLPINLREATDELEGSDMLREALGSEVVDHYVHFFRTEQSRSDAAVTNWERERYFERG